jgi:hypothetical protein
MSIMLIIITHIMHWHNKLETHFNSLYTLFTAFALDKDLNRETTHGTYFPWYSVSLDCIPMEKVHVDQPLWRSLF